ncbi:hypothetical protein Tco_0173398 [Tanacetum coccineum]
MEYLPMCEESENAVGARNWLDMIVLYCRNFTDEHRDGAIRLNMLVGEMNDACQDRIAFVQEIKSVASVTVTGKTAMFLNEMMDKEGSKEWQLRDLAKEAREMSLEIELFVQKLMRVPFVVEISEDLRLAREINALCARVTAIVDEKENFGGKLQILGRGFELRTQEKGIFIEKLKGNMNF